MRHLTAEAIKTYDFEQGYAESTAMIVENMIRKELGMASRSYDAIANNYKAAFLPWEPQMDEGSKLQNKAITKEGSYGLTYAQTNLIWVTIYRDAGML